MKSDQTEIATFSWCKRARRISYKHILKLGFFQRFGWYKVIISAFFKFCWSMCLEKVLNLLTMYHSLLSFRLHLNVWYQVTNTQTRSLEFCLRARIFRYLNIYNQRCPSIYFSIQRVFSRYTVKICLLMYSNKVFIKT